VEDEISLSKLGSSQNLVRLQVEIGSYRAARRALLALITEEHVLAGAFLELLGEIGS